MRVPKSPERPARRAAPPLWLALPLLLLTLAPAALAQGSNDGSLRGYVFEKPISLKGGPALPAEKSAGVTPVTEGFVYLYRYPLAGDHLARRKPDARGYFEFPIVEYGKYTIRVVARDYEVETVPVDVQPHTAKVVFIEIDPEPTSEEAIRLYTRARKGKAGVSLLTQRRSLSDARRFGAYLAGTVNSVALGGASLTRSYDELAFYAPGIAAPPQTISNFAGPGFGAGVGTSGQFSANGLRSRGNNFTVDGSDNNDEDIGVRRQGFLALVPQSVESIYEYQVITALAPAQLGRNIGAQVNAVSQYGTSEVHGSAYGTLSSSLFNSADFFDSTPEDTTLPLTALAGGVEKLVFVDGRQKFVTNGAGGKDRFRFGQAGGTLGGPLWQSPAEGGLKLHYFFSGEFQRLRATRETHFAVPAVEERGLLGTGAAGLTRDPFTGAALDTFPTSAQGDAVFSLFPFPNNPTGVYGRNTFTQELPADGSGAILSVRLDGSRRAGGRLHQFTARYNFTGDHRDVPTVGGAIFSTIRPDVRAQTLSLFANSVLSGEGASVLVSNQFFVSYGRTRFDFEDRREAGGHLIPTRTNISDPDDRRFLLNAPLLQNQTRAGSDAVRYVTSAVATAESRLGTPFELLAAPVGQVNIAGFSPVGVDVFTFPQERVNNTYQLADTVTTQTDRHTFAFGADIRRSELNSRLPRNSRPLITFSGGVKVRPTTPEGFPFVAVGRFSPLDMAAVGAPTGVLQTLTTGDDATIGLRYHQFNFFGREEWRPRERLSLSLGLRYEYNTPPREMNSRIEQTFDSPVLSSVELDAFIDGRRRVFAPDRNNFAPRLGLAFAFGGDGRNVVRAGAGIFYDQVPGVVISQSRNVVPTFITFSTGGFTEFKEDGTQFGLGILLPSTLPIACGDSGRIPVNLPGTLNTINPRVSVACLLGEYLVNRRERFGFEPVLQTVLPAEHLEMPEAYHYAASFERELGRDTVLSVAYVGTQGRHLLRLTTPNLGDFVTIVVPDLVVPDGRPRFGGFMGLPVQRDEAGNLLPRPSRLAGSVKIYETTANSRYDALQLQLRGRFSGADDLRFNYTLSKVTDDVSDIFDLAGAPALPQNSFTFAGERAPANFDARHILSGHFTRALPTFEQSTRRWKELLLGHWEVTGKFRFQTGQPFTVNTVADVNSDGNLTDRPDTLAGIVATGERAWPLRLTVDPATLLAPAQQDGSVGRNTFRAGSLFDLDLSLRKRFHFERPGGTFRELTLRVDVFNLLNRANFGIPVRFLEAPGFGRAVSTVTPARRAQFALRYSF